MSTHTPGPWELDDELAVYDAHNSVPICSVNDRKAGAIANARLIAAAPELLGALKGATDWIESVADEIDDAEGTWAFVRNLRAAIAKATNHDDTHRQLRFGPDGKVTVVGS